MAEKRKPRVIKRYANRKLYDMSESCYITHDEIATLVKAGEEVKIIDNQTKEDLTTITLTQILFDKERQQRKALPLSTIRGLFQTGGDFIQRHITQPVTNLRGEAEETMRKVFRSRGADDAPSEPQPASAAEPQAAPTRSKAPEGLREWLDSTQRNFDAMQRMLEERWNLVVQSLGHFDMNHRRIAELERRVEQLEERLRVLENPGLRPLEPSGDDA